MFDSIDKAILSALREQLKGILDDVSLEENKWTIDKIHGTYLRISIL